MAPDPNFDTAVILSTPAVPTVTKDAKEGSNHTIWFASYCLELILTHIWFYVALMLLHQGQELNPETNHHFDYQ